MKDRIPTYPGRVKLSKVAGSDDLYDMVRADQPTQEGTPLNKSTLLKDATAKLIGLTQADPSVDDALNGVADKVGDIKLTRRTDLGDEWLLCNGDIINLANYPELRGKLEIAYGNYVKDLSISDTNRFDTITSAIVANGYYVLGGRRHDVSDDKYYDCIAYTNTPKGTWTMQDIAPYHSGNKGVSCIAYANGYWVVGFSSYSNPTTYARISYSTSLSGPWTQKTLYGGWALGDRAIECIVYTDGKWFAGGMKRGNTSSDSSSTAILSYTTNLEGTWTNINVWSGNETPNSIAEIKVTNGLFYVVGDYANSGTYTSRIAYNSDPTDSLNWNIKDIWTAPGKSEKMVNTFDLSGKYFVVGGKYRTSSSGGVTYKARVAYSVTSNGNWIVKDLWDCDANGGVNSILFYNGNYILSGGALESSKHIARIAFSEDIKGNDFIIRDLWDSKTTNNINNVINCSVSLGGMAFIFCGVMNNGNTNNKNFATIAINSINDAILPEISLDAYAYIKGK